MSFKDALQHAATGKELQAVMRNLAERGSGNWTYATAARYVAPHLHGDLLRYFDSSGGLARTFVSSGVQAEVQVGQARPDRVEVASRTPLSELIRDFHSKLAAVSTAVAERSAAFADRTLQHGQPQATPLGADGAGAEPEQSTSPRSTDEPEPAPPDHPASTEFMCPICDLPADPRITVRYRQTEMCKDCFLLLRSRG